MPVFFGEAPLYAAEIIGKKDVVDLLKRVTRYF